jgi:hypothetical protein
VAERRLAIYQPNGQPLYYTGTEQAPYIDLRGVPNADASAPFEVHVEQRCSMGQWHMVGSVALPCYDHDDDDLQVMKERWERNQAERGT